MRWCATFKLVEQMLDFSRGANMWANEGFTDILSRGEEEKEVGERRKHKKKAGIAAKSKEKMWRKTSKGKLLKLRNMAKYWKSPKGKAARKRAALAR